MLKTDVLVLGAGIVGVASALQIQARGRDVVLVDRRGAGEETSFGNAGLIERASIFPYLFPRDIRALARYAVNGANEAHYRPADLPAFAAWLARYWWESAPERARRHALAVLPLIERSLSEHETLMAGRALRPAAQDRLAEAVSQRQELCRGPRGGGPDRALRPRPRFMRPAITSSNRRCKAAWGRCTISIRPRSAIRWR